MCEMQAQVYMQAQGNDKFSISCVGVCICVVVVHKCVSLCSRLPFRVVLSPREIPFLVSHLTNMIIRGLDHHSHNTHSKDTIRIIICTY